MITKVKSYRYGIIHSYAHCSECDWNAAVNMSDKNMMQKLRSKVSSHVKKTGHSVNLETAKVTQYSLQTKEQ